MFTLNRVFKNKLLETLDENLKLKYLQLNTKKKYRSDEIKEYLADQETRSRKKWEEVIHYMLNINDI